MLRYVPNDMLYLTSHVKNMYKYKWFTSISLVCCVAFFAGLYMFGFLSYSWTMFKLKYVGLTLKLEEPNVSRNCV